MYVYHAGYYNFAILIMLHRNALCLWKESIVIIVWKLILLAVKKIFDESKLKYFV